MTPLSLLPALSLLKLMMMTARIVLIFAIHSYVVYASVLEATENYFCEEGSQALKWEHASRATDCEQSWIAESIPIGSFMRGIAECHSPCINVTAGTIIISGCVNVTLTVICYQGHLTEYRVHYVGAPNNPLPLQNFQKRGRYGIWAGLTLLFLMIVGFAIQHRLRLRNSQSIQL